MQNDSTQAEINLPHSPAAERNKSAILEKLKQIFQGDEKVLEIGSGTGQHAVHFCKAMPGLTWQPTDLPERIPVSNAVIATANCNNILKTCALDASSADWPDYAADVVYTANTAHIMPWQITQTMLRGAAKQLRKGGRLIIYGPFKYSGDFTSESNGLFDASLKRNNPQQGIRDFEGIERVSKEGGLVLEHDFSMPANNQLLVFCKQ
ncbi:MAG: DUF938 domain-containing protein [Gammaproteobacteria bacterium]|nr:DUF938 domain-containing protein [Gammaproteobacteria bacterium]